jgi:hypothetical protein
VQYAGIVMGSTIKGIMPESSWRIRSQDRFNTVDIVFGQAVGLVLAFIVAQT